MQRYFVYLSYDGAAYHGWQLQPNALSVQACMETALSTLLRAKTMMVAAGRTDAGVHARLMVAHFDAAEPVADTADLCERLNRLLPPDIAVHRVRPVRPDAHARFDATSRTYQYYVATRKPVFNRQYVYRIYHTPDFARMNEAASRMLTCSDFSSFCKTGSDVATHLCRVQRAEWTPAGPDTYVFTITADRFLRNMVRATVGTLLEVGRGRLTPDGFADILGRRNRCAAGTSVPGEALFLTDITYPDTLFIDSGPRP